MTDLDRDTILRDLADAEADHAATKRWAARLASERGNALLRAEAAETRAAAAEARAETLARQVEAAKALADEWEAERDAPFGEAHMSFGFAQHVLRAVLDTATEERTQATGLQVDPRPGRGGASPPTAAPHTATEEAAHE